VQKTETSSFKKTNYMTSPQNKIPLTSSSLFLYFLLVCIELERCIFLTFLYFWQRQKYLKTSSMKIWIIIYNRIPLDWMKIEISTFAFYNVGLVWFDSTWGFEKQNQDCRPRTWKIQVTDLSNNYTSDSLGSVLMC
jgi:hypothetical protein